MIKHILVPRVVIATDAGIVVDAAAIAKVMSQLGVASADIARTTLYIESRKRFVTNGVHYPFWLAKIRFRSHPEVGVVTGDVLTITCNKYFGRRSAKVIAKTIAHESVHLAQASQRSILPLLGHATIWSMIVLGVILGYQLNVGRPVLMVLGGLYGYALGYTLAPHEHQARSIASSLGDKELEKFIVRR